MVLKTKMAELQILTWPGTTHTGRVGDCLLHTCSFSQLFAGTNFSQTRDL